MRAKNHHLSLALLQNIREALLQLCCSILAHTKESYPLKTCPDRCPEYRASLFGPPLCVVQNGIWHELLRGLSERSKRAVVSVGA
jgi:hypothetical protein